MVFGLLAAYAAPAVGGALGAIGSYLGVPAILSVVGFSSIGVTAGSIAAGIQSYFGLVTAGLQHSHQLEWQDCLPFQL